MDQAVGQGEAVHEIKIFVSSPGDVIGERRRLQRVVERLNGQLGGKVRLRCVLWEDRLYTSKDTFQGQIESAAACDIVISIFWTRLGTPLPPEFGEHLPDGRSYPSGTAYEVLTALEAARQKPLPDVFVFRKTKAPTIDPGARRLFNEQMDLLEHFWEEWFVSREGYFRAAFNNFDSTDDFEAQAEKLLREWLIGHGIAYRRVRWSLEERGSPFRGLLPFEAVHAEVFFGRSAEVERGRERLIDAAGRNAPFLLILGASGSGKSSLARAGLIPRLVSPGSIETVDVWRVARFTLGIDQGDLLQGLAAALLDHAALPELTDGPNGTVEGIVAQLSLGGPVAVGLVKWAFDRIAGQVRARDGYDRPVQPRLILLLDQFEGLFPAAASGARGDELIAAIDALVRSGLVWAIATLRTTEYGFLQANQTLLHLKDDGASLDLTPPDQVNLAEVIRGPADAAGLAFERDTASGRGLDEILRTDVGGADALPLLQFTLEHLYEKREVREGIPTLTLSAYRALGGIEGAIAAEAERTVSTLPQASQAQLPWLLRHLVGAPPQGANGLVLREMTLADADLVAHPGAEALVSALVSARILVLDSVQDRRASRIRLAHEAVLRGWERARSFVERNAQYFQQMARLQATLEQWQLGNSSPDHLLRGTPLSTAEDLVRTYGSELSPGMLEFVRSSRRLADRGRRIAYAVAACMALLFIGAAVGGLYAMHERAAALESFAVAKKTADSIVLDLAEGLRDVEGIRTEAVGRILGGAERAYARLSQVSPGDPDLLNSQAVMYIAFSDTYASQGDTQRQFYSAKSALEIMERVAQMDARKPEIERDLSLAHERMGNALATQGNLPASLKAFEKSLKINEGLTRVAPDNPEWRYAVSRSFGKIGDVLIAQGNLAAALKAHRDSLDIRRQLVNLDPAAVDWQRNLGRSYLKVGDVLVMQAELVPALAAYRDALSIFEKVPAGGGSRESSGWQRDIPVTYDRIGDALLLQNDREGALKAYRDSLTIRLPLAASDKGNSLWQRDLSVSYNKLGSLRLAEGKVAEALKEFQDSLAIGERLALVDSHNPGWQRDLAVSYNKVGDALVLLGEKQPALKAFLDSLAISERLADLDPTNISWQLDVVAAQWRLASLGDSAPQRWKMIVDKLRGLRDEGRLTPNLSKWLTEAEAELARTSPR